MCCSVRLPWPWRPVTPSRLPYRIDSGRRSLCCRALRLRRKARQQRERRPESIRYGSRDGVTGRHGQGSRTEQHILFSHAPAVFAEAVRDDQRLFHEVDSPLRRPRRSGGEEKDRDIHPIPPDRIACRIASIKKRLIAQISLPLDLLLRAADDNDMPDSIKQGPSLLELRK